MTRSLQEELSEALERRYSLYRGSDLASPYGAIGALKGIIYVLRSEFPDIEPRLREIIGQLSKSQP